jgi:PiT family inorganic phosphate transporter
MTSVGNTVILALIGGVIGATLAAAGGSAVKWQGLVSKVIIPAALSPVIAALIAAVGTYLLYRISRAMTARARSHGFRIGQIGSAGMVSLAHGTNDARKTMGVITLALITNGSLPSGAQAPDWVIVACALAISAGTYVGGWRVIRTLGRGLVEIDSPQGMAAESSSAAVILLSASFGYSLSTTHVATGSIIGTGLGKKGAAVRWGVAGRMATAWVFTLPSAALVGAGAQALSRAIRGTPGVVVILVLLAVITGYIYLRSRATRVDHKSVNAEWTGSVGPGGVAVAASAQAGLTGPVT